LNRVLRKIFGPKRSDVTGHWKKKTVKEVPDGLYFSSDVLLESSNKGR